MCLVNVSNRPQKANEKRLKPSDLGGVCTFSFHRANPEYNVQKNLISCYPCTYESYH
jgi:hypothetical protein